MATMAPPTDSSYPVRFDVEYPEHLSRLLIFVKFILAIPHLVVLYALMLASSVVTFVAWFAILFTKKYPEGLFKFNVGIQRWQQNVSAYVWLLRDEYPPFSFDAGQYPVSYEVEYPAELSRWLIFVKWLLVFPNLLVFLLVAIVAYFATFAAWFAILFTGRYPRGMFDFVVGTLRWAARANAYSNLLTDKYPPFSMKP